MGIQVYLVFLAGVAVGTLLCEIIWSIQSAKGTLKIDTSNPEKDVYRIDIDNLDMLSKRRKLVCKIEHDAILTSQSQE